MAARLNARAALALAFILSVTGGRADSPEGIDLVVGEAIASRLISGAVVCAGGREGVRFEKAYGTSGEEASSPPLIAESVFDVASLTKVVVTAPVVLKLVEKKRLRLDDPVSKWFEEFVGHGRADVQISHLLTHTSGFKDVPLEGGRSVQGALKRLARQKGAEGPGTNFLYADINFILLGEIVRRETGTGLDRWAAEVVFSPLGMKDSCFVPAAQMQARCVPTRTAGGGALLGVVQDSVARELGGIAGHAGAFSTAGDLSRFCRMMMNSGSLDGRRVFSPETVKSMCMPRRFLDGTVIRGLGWDILSPFSSPRVPAFSSASFGHTGYSGGSLWIDPDQDLFVILLTARTDYRRTREFNQLRSDVSAAAASLLLGNRRGPRPGSTEG